MISNSTIIKKKLKQKKINKKFVNQRPGPGACSVRGMVLIPESDTIATRLQAPVNILQFCTYLIHMLHPIDLIKLILNRLLKYRVASSVISSSRVLTI